MKEEMDGVYVCTCPTEIAASAVWLHVQGPVYAYEGGSNHEDEDWRQHDQGWAGGGATTEVPPEAVVAAQNDVQLQHHDQHHKDHRHHLRSFTADETHVHSCSQNNLQPGIRLTIHAAQIAHMCMHACVDLHTN